MNAAIVLFVYCRPDHTRRTVSALLRNPEAANSDLVVFSDGPRGPGQMKAVQQVRDYIQEIKGFRSLKVHQSSQNLGLSRSIIEGVTHVLTQYDRVIVLEDDIITSSYFLRYMNDALDLYQNDERVISVHGYSLPTSTTLPDTFFLRGADCWGWGTWRRGWDLFNPDGKFLLDQLKCNNLIREFNLKGAYSYSKMLEQQIKGLNDSWAVRWHASAFIANKLTLHPGRSLVHNIGNDSSGTHSITTTALDAVVSETQINVRRIPIAESSAAKKAYEFFFRAQRYPLRLLASISSKEKLYLKLKTITKDWLPPKLKVHLQNWFWRNDKITFDGPFASWQEAEAKSSGYQDKKILEKVLSATLAVKRKEAVFERDSVLFDEIQYSWPITAALMWAAARCDGCLSVLDFGGSLGTSYFQNRKFLADLKSVRWSVVEQEHFVKTGRDHIQDERLCFYSTIAGSISADKPNVILLSSVLQYLEDPYEILEELVESDAELILVDRTPFLSVGSSDIFKVQINPKSINLSRYPIRYFSCDNFINWFHSRGPNIVEEFPSLDELDPIANWKGLIFLRNEND